MNISRLSNILMRTVSTTGWPHCRQLPVLNKCIISIWNNSSPVINTQHKQFHKSRALFDEDKCSENESLNIDSGVIQHSKVEVSTGSDISQHTKVEVSTESDISQHTKVEVSTGSDISQHTKVEEVSTGSDISQHTKVEVSTGSDISQHTKVEVSTGSDISQYKEVEVSTGSDLSEDEPLRFDKLFSRIRIECRAHEEPILRSYAKFAVMAAEHLDVRIVDIKYPRRLKIRRTLLKSAFVHKKHRVQYETKTLFVVMTIINITESTMLTYLEYIQRNIPEGVSMLVRTHELCRFPEFVEKSKYYKTLSEFKKNQKTDSAPIDKTSSETLISSTLDLQ